MTPIEPRRAGLARRITFISALLTTSAVAASTLVPTAAQAEGSTRTRVERLLGELKPKASDAEVARLTARAKDALERAAVTRVPEVSAALEAAALEWAQAASTWIELRRAETEATEREQALDELRSRVKHVRAQLEETEARRSRAAGLLERKNAPGEQAAAPATSTQPAATQPAATQPAAERDKPASAREREVPPSRSPQAPSKVPAPPAGAPTPKDPAPPPQQVKP